MQKIIITLFFTCILGVAHSENFSFPRNCQSGGYNFYLKTLRVTPGSIGGRNSLYLFYNNSDKAIKLYHMHDKDHFFNVYLNNTIRPNRWAVFASNEKEINYVCTQSERGKEFGKIVSCKDFLKICEYPKVRFGINTRGNLWIVSNVSENSAVRGIVRYGIIP